MDGVWSRRARAFDSGLSEAKCCSVKEAYGVSESWIRGHSLSEEVTFISYATLCGASSV